MIRTWYLFLGMILMIHCNTEQTSGKPNIILIMTDDQGIGDVGFNGNPYVRTPNLDALAAKSIRFRQFYVSPVCAPTRSSLLTGRYSLRTGVYDTYNGGATMATEEFTLAEMLRDHGYATGIFGKWHLGDTYPHRPTDQGFEEAWVHRGGGIGQPGDFTNFFARDSSYFDPLILHNDQLVNTEGYCSDVFTDRLIDFIDRQSEVKPFFAYLSFNAPHTPLQLPGKYWEMYQNVTFDSSAFPTDGRITRGLNPRELDFTRRVYGMVTNIDDNVGKIMHKLTEKQLDKQTIVIFLTDNGPQGYRYRMGLRGGKGTVYEGGVKVPFIFYHPGTESFDVHQPSAHFDLLPTLADLIGIQVELEKLDGQSLAPWLREPGRQEVPRSICYYWQRGFEEPYRNTAIRDGDYKLVAHQPYTAPVDSFELFNIKEDPAEQNNIVSESRDIAVKLKTKLDTWYDEIIRSPHLAIKPIPVGTEHENPVFFNINDAKGVPAPWGNEKTISYWDIEVANEGDYQIQLTFRRKVAPGMLNVRLGRIQRAVPVSDSTQVVKIPSIHLFPHQGLFEIWYREAGKPYGDFVFPLVTEVEKL